MSEHSVDPEALGHPALARLRPVSLAGEQLLPVGGELAGSFPGGGVQKGSVVVVEGEPGAGATSVALGLIAGATAAGEWAAVVERPSGDPAGAGILRLRPTLGALAAAEAGVVLDRLAVVHGVPTDRWSTVVAVLLEGVGLVVAEPPPRVRAVEARRLLALARERRSVLVILGSWPEAASLRLRAGSSVWEWRHHVVGRSLSLEVERRGHPVRRLSTAVGA